MDPDRHHSVDFGVCLFCVLWYDETDLHDFDIARFLGSHFDHGRLGLVYTAQIEGEDPVSIGRCSGAGICF